jgi:3-isopropylmalate/(R)-2-methylmalate dehydratase large subunit
MEESAKPGLFARDLRSKIFLDTLHIIRDYPLTGTGLGTFGYVFPFYMKASIDEALAYMKLPAGTPIKGVKIDVAFIGSCTNGRISDFREVAKFIQGHRVAAGVKAIAVPGSQIVAIQCEQEGIPEIFRAAGFEWRGAGCSMCLAMNPDKLVGDQLCASSSNRNFKGRQGSPTGRTVLMSPVMVAAAAINGSIADAREVFDLAPQANVA